MIYGVEEITRDVRQAMDINRTDEALLADGDVETSELDALIRSNIADGARQILLEAPLSTLEDGHDFGHSPLFMNDDGKGFIILPDDFLRLVCFRMSDWRRAVFEAISPADPEYALQSSRLKGICGNPERPVCALLRRAEGKVLEFYSCLDLKATVAQAAYIPIPVIDCDDGIDIPEDCHRAVVLRTAALTLASLGEQQSATLTELSRAALGG